MDPVNVSGSCLCKQVRYTITGEEVASTLCHCKNCQQVSGSAFGANAVHLKTNFSITQGEDAIKQYADSDTASGNTLLRHFCSNCGSPLFILNPGRPETMVVTSGSMENMDQFKPTLEFWTKHRRGWVEEVEGAKTWEAGRT